eukprot:gb/GECH01002400.1/.p1 GENE.gb/GECH01002400.1/~~gb/GECH01002400.1/.p1  ORF type:complete len:154 (+),score=34.20 gb/GECH01002400.1/:1-462(+)
MFSLKTTRKRCSFNNNNNIIKKSPCTPIRINNRRIFSSNFQNNYSFNKQNLLTQNSIWKNDLISSNRRYVHVSETFHSDIEYISTALEFIKSRFEQDKIKEKYLELKKETQVPDIWNNPPRAQRLMKRQAALESKLSALEKAQQEFQFHSELI